MSVQLVVEPCGWQEHKNTWWCTSQWWIYSSVSYPILYIIMLEEKIKMKEKRFQEVVQSSVTLVHLLNPLRIKIAPFSRDYHRDYGTTEHLRLRFVFLNSWSSTKPSKNRDWPKLDPNRGRFKHDRYSPYLCTMMCRKTEHLNEGCLRCLCENEEFQSDTNRSVPHVSMRLRPKKLIISNPVSGQSPPITVAVSWDPHTHTRGLKYIRTRPIPQWQLPRSFG